MLLFELISCIVLYNIIQHNYYYYIIRQQTTYIYMYVAMNESINWATQLVGWMITRQLSISVTKPYSCLASCGVPICILILMMIFWNFKQLANPVWICQVIKKTSSSSFKNTWTSGAPKLLAGS